MPASTTARPTSRWNCCAGSIWSTTRNPARLAAPAIAIRGRGPVWPVALHYVARAERRCTATSSRPTSCSTRPARRPQDTRHRHRPPHRSGRTAPGRPSLGHRRRSCSRTAAGPAHHGRLPTCSRSPDPCYQMLTGQLPFRADSMPTLMLRDRPRAAPADPARCVRRTAGRPRRFLRPRPLAKDPAARFESGAAFAHGAARPQHDEARLTVHLKGKLTLRGGEQRAPHPRAQRGHRSAPSRHRPRRTGDRHGRLQGRRGSRTWHRRAHHHGPGSRNGRARRT